MKGRKPIPNTLKLLRGNPGRRPIVPSPDPAPGIPEAPEIVAGEARVEWDRMVPLLAPIGLLTPVERAGLTAYCLAWSDYVEARRTGKGRTAAFACLMKTCVELGLTPSSRSRIKVEVAKPKSKVDSFREKHGG